MTLEKIIWFLVAVGLIWAVVWTVAGGSLIPG